MSDAADNVDGARTPTSSAAASSAASSAATSAAAEIPSVTSAATAPRTLSIPIEHGPLSLGQACMLVKDKYGNSFTSIQYHLDPVLCDGSIVRFTLPGNNMELGQGVVRFGNEILFDKDQNALVQLLVYNLSYPRTPTSVVFRQ